MRAKKELLLLMLLEMEKRRPAGAGAEKKGARLRSCGANGAGEGTRRGVAAPRRAIEPAHAHAHPQTPATPTTVRMRVGK